MSNTTGLNSNVQATPEKEATTIPGPSTSHLTILNAHNGYTVKVPKPVRFHTLQAFKTFIYESFTNYLIGGTENIFLLTSFGIKFNFNMINELNDVYVYDKRLFSNGNNGELLESYSMQGENEPENNTSDVSQGPLQLSQISKPRQSPVVINSSSTTIKNLSSNIKINESWARALLQDSRGMDQQIRNLVRQINILFKCLNIVFSFGSNFVSGIEKSFNNYFNYIKLTNMKTLHRSWNKYYRNLKQNMSPFKVNDFDNHEHTINLSNMLHSTQLETSALYISENLPKVVQRFNDMSIVINSVNEDKISIDSSIEKLRNESIDMFKGDEFSENNNNGSKYTTEVHQIVKIISQDLENIRANSNSTSTQTLDTIHQTHIEKLSPQIYKSVSNLYDKLQNIQTFKRRLSSESLAVFINIANLQMRMVNLKEDLKSLTSPNGGKDIGFETINKIKAHEDYLSLAIDLPLLFGFMMIEKRRQYEWFDFYSKGIVKNISEQLSVMIDHERLFRKLWLKKFGGFLGLLESRFDENGIAYQQRPRLPTIDVTLVNNTANLEDIGGPLLSNIQVGRNDILEYIKSIKKYSELSVSISPSSQNFAGLLEKNFDDLVKCTGNMKKVTKIVASLSTLTSPSSNDSKASKMDNFMGAISQHGSLKYQNKLKSGVEGHHNESLGDGTEVSDDMDLNVITGLKSRIKKLENLLHQQQYRNLSQWPVTRPVGNESHDGEGAKMSLIVEKRGVSDPTSFLSKRVTTGVVTPPSPNNPRSSPSFSGNGAGHKSTNGHDGTHAINSNSSKILDASTTIDKHLDNIRLRKENTELMGENKRLSNINTSLEDTANKLRNEILLLKEEHEEKLKLKDEEIEINKRDLQLLKNDLDSQNNNLRLLEQENEILRKRQDDIVTELGKEKEETVATLQEEISKYIGMNHQKYEEIMKMNTALESIRVELRDSTGMKNDLLSNMSAKETEITQERNRFMEEIKGLKQRIDEITDDYEDLMELTQTKQTTNEHLITELKDVVVKLVSKIKEQVKLSFDFYSDFCLVLESMGLLLIRDANDELKIVRVKGLRSKKEKEREKEKGGTQLLDDHEISTPLRPTSKVLEQISGLLKVITDLDVDHLAIDEEESIPSTPNLAQEVPQTQEPITDIVTRYPSVDSKTQEQGDELIKQIRENFESSKYENMLRELRFSAEPKDDQLFTEGNSAFVSAIAKRFGDVEGFAKKLTKENRSKANEITKLTNKLSTKISMNDFQVNDLVLFLPTRIDRMDEIDENFQPWAAFNFGSPHYFLRVTNNSGNIHELASKDWMVGRIEEITEHVVSEENKDDRTKNPFSLSLGVNWFYVDAKEVEMV
ncbi:autophagy-related protein 11 [[Candida] anglica]|uniref:Autophagy-related protein 11 n=1 Tax=[Candida] anglica TaxID=148631 RepID=A0ABP0EAX4_9ASCO